MKEATFELEPVATEIVPPSLLEIMQRAEIDVQIATAHRFPRSMATFQKRALSMATIDEETAESCLYRRPVGRDGNGKETFAEGMSVRMAEIVGASYGNLRVYATIIEQTERQIIARGMAIDLESNFASSAEVIEATVKRDGKPYGERMRVMIAKSALAKARRDATFQVVPRALAKPVEAEVRRVLCGDSKTIERRREAVLNWMSKIGIDSARVWAALGIKGEEDLDADQLERLTGIKTAIKDGDTSLDEAFPAIDQKPVFEKTREPKAEKTRNVEPQRATPLDGVLNLIKASRTTPDAVLAYVRNEVDIKADSLSDLDNSIFTNLINNWDIIINDIKSFEEEAK